MLLLLILTATIAQADFHDLHGNNYNAIGNYCSMHFEVDGNTLYATAIINELHVISQNAKYATCGSENARCNGEICFGDGVKFCFLKNGVFIWSHFVTL